MGGRSAVAGKNEVGLRALTDLRPVGPPRLALPAGTLCSLLAAVRRMARRALAGGAVVASAFAQLGDSPGERQVSLVPAAQIPPATVVPPDATLSRFRIAPGYQLELMASEPLVQDPVAITFGPDGRLWAVEMRGFMPNLDGQGEDEPVGRVVVLADRDGDGRYDEPRVFVDGLWTSGRIRPEIAESRG